MLKRLALAFARAARPRACAPAARRSRGLAVSDTYSGDELVDTGGEFFGSVAQGLASLVERAVSQFGLPNGYILGEEAGGALFAGARYGEGTLYTRNAGRARRLLAGPDRRLRRRRRRLQGHDAGLQPQRGRATSSAAIPASMAPPMSSAASA